jgi:hypothetical protein
MYGFLSGACQFVDVFGGGYPNRQACTPDVTDAANFILDRQSHFTAVSGRMVLRNIRKIFVLRKSTPVADWHGSEIRQRDRARNQRRDG